MQSFDIMVPFKSGLLKPTQPIRTRLYIRGSHHDKQGKTVSFDGQLKFFTCMSSKAKKQLTFTKRSYLYFRINWLTLNLVRAL